MDQEIEKILEIVNSGDNFEAEQIMEKSIKDHETEQARHYAPNYYISPFVRWQLRGMITQWLNSPAELRLQGQPKSPTLREYPFDEDDSFSWTVKDMIELEEKLR